MWDPRVFRSFVGFVGDFGSKSLLEVALYCPELKETLKNHRRFSRDILKYWITWIYLGLN